MALAAMTPSQIVLAVAVVAATAVPAIVLWPQKPPVAEGVVTKVTPFAVRPVPTIEPAVTAPLFDVTRAPPPPPEPAKAIPAVPLPPPAPPPDLVGAIAAPGGGLALVRTGDGSTVVVRVGAAVEGWQLLAVQGGRATFALGDRREDVALDFRNRTAGTGSGAAGSPPASLPGPSAPAATPASSALPSSGRVTVPADPDPPR